MTGSIYHERQMKELCALHTLNNLFQEREFNKQELDQICYGLSPDVWINPHKSLLGLGNYDINVIMAALQRKNCEAIWFDKRRDPKCLLLNNIYGFILNVPTEYKFGFVSLPLKKRHWITLKKLNGFYYNLDSKLDAPYHIGDDDEFFAYLKDQIDCKDKELFVVVSREVSSCQSWLCKSDNFDDIEVKKNDSDKCMIKQDDKFIENGLKDLNDSTGNKGTISNDEKFDNSCSR